MATERPLGPRLRDVLGTPHDTATTVLIAVVGLGLAAVASWIGADVLPRLPLFAVAFAASIVFLYSRETRRGVVANALYALAALLALAPLGYELPSLLDTTDPVAHVLTTTDLLLLALFLALGAIPALVGYRIQTGPFLPRLQERLRGRQ